MVVHLQTEFDQPAAVVTVPVKIAASLGDHVHMVDGVLRSERSIGRVSMSPAMVGLKVVAAGRPVRVTIRLTADGSTASYLRDLQARALSPVTLAPYDTRELVIRSQGRTRAAVMLGRRATDFTFRSSATVRFDLAADEITDDGLVLIELAEVVRGSQAAVGLRVDTIEITAIPAAAPARIPGGTVPATQLIAYGLAGTGVPAAKGTALLTSDAFVVMANGSVANGSVANGSVPTWILRANLTRPVAPDPLRRNPGPLLPARPTGAAAPRIREKAIALGRRKASEARFLATQRFRHLSTWLLLSVVVAPVAWLLAAVWFRTGPISATIEPVTGLAPTGEPPMACTVRRMARRRIAVTAPATFHDRAPAGPAVVRLTGRRFLGLRPAWILTSARTDATAR
jgi:hypothetical protein